MATHMIRPLHFNDIPWLVEQETRIFSHTLGVEHYQTLWQLSSLFGYVIDQKAALVCSKNEEHVQIENLFVLPDYRRLGLATSLLQQLLNELVTQNIRYVSLEVRVDLPHVIELYQSLGFQILKQISNYYPDQTDAYYMLYERSHG
jgi:ribosomal protein S18 acetylase RimI-like enzyme